MTKVISLGGSLIAPNCIDEEFITSFKNLVINYLAGNPANKLILVVGGGGVARQYQMAAKNICPNVSNNQLDWIGIAATKINATLIKTILGDDVCPSLVVDNPETGLFDTGRVLVACGWKPGFSSDYDAVVLAGRFNGSQVINLSNIDYVYTDDPHKNPNAKPITNINWANFRKMIGTSWQPGANLPFDPIASKLAEELKLTVIIAKGQNLDNVHNILMNKDYMGTTIG